MIQPNMNDCKQAIETYLSRNNYRRLDLKAVLFDMDGVLYDSMPNHTVAWCRTMERHRLHLTEEDVYLNEGQTGESTIAMVSRRQGVFVTPQEIEAIYKEKTEAFNACPPAQRMPGSYELLRKVVNNGLLPMIVTGSGQSSLLERLNMHFPNIFSRERMITAADVKHGKPDPEPYLMALERGDLRPWEAIVVENAPLGVEAAHTAGIFTIAVNTGPLNDLLLHEAGADLLFSDMPALCNQWKKIRESARCVDTNRLRTNRRRGWSDHR